MAHQDINPITKHGEDENTWVKSIKGQKMESFLYLDFEVEENSDIDGKEILVVVEIVVDGNPDKVVPGGKRVFGELGMGRVRRVFTKLLVEGCRRVEVLVKVWPAGGMDIGFYEVKNFSYIFYNELYFIGKNYVAPKKNEVKPKANIVVKPEGKPEPKKRPAKPNPKAQDNKLKPDAGKSMRELVISQKKELCLERNQLPPKSGFVSLRFFSDTPPQPAARRTLEKPAQPAATPVATPEKTEPQPQSVPVQPTAAAKPPSQSPFIISYEENLLNRKMRYQSDIFLSAWVKVDSSFTQNLQGYLLSVSIESSATKTNNLSTYSIIYNYAQKSWTFGDPNSKTLQRLGAIDLPPSQWHSIGIKFSREITKANELPEERIRGYILIGGESHPYKLFLDKPSSFFKPQGKVHASFGVDSPQSNVSQFQGLIYGAYLSDYNYFDLFEYQPNVFLDFNANTLKNLGVVRNFDRKDGMNNGEFVQYDPLFKKLIKFRDHTEINS
jgi:hypothetical protein